jgi:uncharacterized protein involved in outer membrane biogenesis
MRIRRVLTGLVIVAVGAVAAVFAIVNSIDFNNYKDVVAAQVKAATGRDLVLSGDVKVAVSLTPKLEVGQVSFRNADWGSEPQMVKLDRLEADIELIPLLSNQIRIHHLKLVGADILLETDKNGQGNWVMGTGNGGSTPLPDIADASIENAKIRFRNGVTGVTRSFAASKLTIAPSDTPGRLALAYEGQIDAVPVSWKGLTGSLANFVQGPLPIDGTGQVGGADLGIKGEIAEPAKLQGVALDLSLAGKSAADVAKAFGLNTVTGGGFDLRGKLTGAAGKYAVDGFSAKLGGSDATGHVDIDLSTVPMTLNASLASSHLDLGDLGIHPAEKTAPSSDGRVFSAEPWDFSPLKAVNGAFRLNAQQLLYGKTTLQNVTGELSLQDGKLKISSLSANLGDGQVALAANVDANAAPAAIEARLRANDVDGVPLLDAMGLGGAITAGRVTLEATVQGPGPSLRGLMAGLNGGLYMEMGQGALKNDFARLMFADLFQLVTFGGTSDASRVNCMVTSFATVGGVATAKTLVLDTPGVTVLGSGDVDFRDESLHLHLDSNSKQVNLANLAVPMNVSGSLANPRVTPDALGAVGNTADFAARTANTVTFGALASLTGLGQSNGGGNPCVGAAEAGAKAQQSSAGQKIIDGLGTAADGVGQGAKELGQGAVDATKKAGEDAGKALDDMGKSLNGIFGN